MKGLSIFAAILGGMAIGAACGILFAPEKGDETRAKIAEAIRASSSIVKRWKTWLTTSQTN